MLENLRELFMFKWLDRVGIGIKIWFIFSWKLGIFFVVKWFIVFFVIKVIKVSFG